jgi:hypothetical protein
MNKFVASVGLVAIGAATAHAQYAPGLTPLEMSKAWSLSADLRGFYDDNYLTLPKSLRQSTWGTEISPSVAVNHSVQDTLFSASYVYDLRWYATHPAPGTSTDQSHQFNARLEHEFSERYKIALNESFVIAQEPTVIDPTVISTPLRVEGNNVRNTGQADFTASLTKLLDLHLGYGNTVYAYQQTAADVVGYPFSPLTGYSAFPGQATTPFEPSRSASLDRMEQVATLDLRWKIAPDTTGVFGYQFENVDYTSPEYIIYPDAALGTLPNGTLVEPGYLSKIRNNDQHFGFIGVDESFTPDLTASIRVGAEYLDYYNYHTTKAAPYVDANLTWQYTAQSTAQVGVKQEHNATDVTGYSVPVLDTDATALYASVNHAITDRFTINAMGQAQWSTFNGGDEAGVGSIDGKSEDFYVIGVNLAYHFNPWFLTEAGYDYSKLNSEIIDRSYTRNQVYLGFRGTY